MDSTSSRTETDASQASPDATDSISGGAGAGFTPGPWELSLARLRVDAPIFGFAIRAPGRIPAVASAGVYAEGVLIVAPEWRTDLYEYFTEAEVEANARLIAAAPDLLAALEGLIAVQNGSPLVTWESDWRDAMDSAALAVERAKPAARAAISRATRSPTGG